MRIGTPARAALTETLAHSSAEVRTRARRILDYVLDAELEAQLAALLADADGSRQHDLPAWRLFRDRVGSDAGARQLFVEMQRAEVALLRTLGQNPRQAAEFFPERWQLMCSQWLQWLEAVELEGDKAPALSHAVAARAAALVFVAAQRDVALDEPTSMQISQYIGGVFRVAATNPQQEGALKRLAGQWVLKDGTQAVLQQNLYLSLNWSLPEGLQLAERCLKQTDLPAYVRQHAVLVVGKLGTREHVPLLEPLLADAAPCAAVPLQGRHVQTQLRDVALASMIKLAGQNVKDFGFDRAQENEMFLFNIRTLGFSDSNAREAAMAKWRQWWLAHKPAPDVRRR